MKRTKGLFRWKKFSTAPIFTKKCGTEKGFPPFQQGFQQGFVESRVETVENRHLRTVYFSSNPFRKKMYKQPSGRNSKKAEASCEEIAGTGGRGHAEGCEQAGGGSGGY